MSPLESVGIVAQENTIATLPAMIHSLGVQTSRSTWVELVIETLPWHEYRLQSLGKSYFKFHGAKERPSPDACNF